MALLSKSQILADDSEYTVVSAFGGGIKVRSMNVAELFQFHCLLSAAQESKDFSEVITTAVCWCVVDEKNDPMFSADDIVGLSKKSYQELNKVFQAIVSLNTISDVDVEAAKKN